MDRHRFDADLYPDLNWHQNDADPHADSSYKPIYFFTLSQHCQFTMFYFCLSHQFQMSIIFIIFDRILKFSEKSFFLSTSLFAWTRYQSGSGKMMRIRPNSDPDP